jgi:hypothetical protein
MILPEEYVCSKFFLFAGLPKRNKYNNTYQGSCPMCKEGDSWLKQRRFYFLPKKNLVYCHNCGYSKTPLNWIKEICGITFWQIKEELNDSSVEITIEEERRESVKVDTLPKDCINLFDTTQVSFYKTNKVLKEAIKFLGDRKLFDCVNSPKAFYLSLTDFVHKNRIVIPFYDESGKIAHYQTRLLLDSDKESRPRYISKIGSEKTLFNFNNIKPDNDTIFIFEGPFNSCFTENGVAVAGIQEDSYQLFSPKQEIQMSKYPLHEKIWILDSQWKDTASRNKSHKLLETGQNVFIWPEKVGKKYKDFNDICIDLNANKISAEYIKKHTFSGDEGFDKLSKIH